jgi:hypothetical protein
MFRIFGKASFVNFNDGNNSGIWSTTKSFTLCTIENNKLVNIENQDLVDLLNDIY